MSIFLWSKDCYIIGENIGENTKLKNGQVLVIEKNHFKFGTNLDNNSVKEKQHSQSCALYLVRRHYLSIS